MILARLSTLARLTLKLIGCGLIIVLLCETAFAKKASIEWKPIPGALRYDLVIQNETQVILRKTLEDPKWKGNLPHGVYQYQIRGIDGANRPGNWTDWKPLALMPPPPRTRFPADGGKVEVYAADIPTHLKWDAVEGVTQYMVEVRSNGQRVSLTSVRGTETEMKGLPHGKYEWSVKPVLEISGRAPASLRGKTWESPESEKAEFEILQKKLEAPTLVRPLGTLAPPEDQVTKLRWEEVEGAQGYQVHITRAPRKYGATRELASELGKARVFFTKERTAAVRVGGSDGQYVWGVRALAHVDAKGSAAAIGPETIGQFTLDRNAVYTDDLGYIALSTMLAPYSYKVVSPISQVQGTSSASSLVYRFSGEYWLKPLWAIAVAGELANFEMLRKSFTRPTVEVTGKFRTKLSSGQFGWSLSPKVGAEIRDYNQVIPINPTNAANGLLVNDVYVLGAAMGFDLRRQFSEKFGLGVKVSYFLPLALGGPVAGQGGKITGDASTRNVSLGVQGLYWISPSVGLGAGGYFELRSIGFTTSATPATTPEQIYMDGAYFFGSLVWRFWR